MKFLEDNAPLLMIVGFILIGIGGLTGMKYSFKVLFTIPNLVILLGACTYLTGRIGMAQKRKK